jgi:hypothetical protein
MGEEENKEEEAHNVTTKTAAGATDPAATNGHTAEGGGELNEGRKVLHAEARADKGSDSDDGDTSDTFHDAESTSPGLDDAEQKHKPEKATLSVPGNSTATAGSWATQLLRGESQEQLPPAEDDLDKKDKEASAAQAVPETSNDVPENLNKDFTTSPIRKRKNTETGKGPAISEWSHQQLAPHKSEEEEEEEEEEWKAMPAEGDYDIYDDDGRLVAKAGKDYEEEAYTGLGGAGKGYTRLQLDEDAQSATSMDEDTNYLFKEGAKPNTVIEEEEQRDAVAQLQATKDLLTEGQRIAYVGVTRLVIYGMVGKLQVATQKKSTKKDAVRALESMEKWGQQMMVRLYSHMDIDSAEQMMVEQLAEHGVQPADLCPALMQNSKIKNPMADSSNANESVEAVEEQPPPAYEAHEGSKSPAKSEVLPKNSDEKPEELSKVKTTEQQLDEVPDVKATEEMPQTANIELDIRWTVLCDLFLLLLSDGVYDSRSRYLLEQVAAGMDISWVQICRFEKRVLDALEMQEATSKEQWQESDHLETRRKMGLKKKYMVMGLATVGGGLVIGLSAGLLAPVIGAGLAAGFTTIGVTGTAGFLGGIGGAALVTSAATATGGTIAIRAANRRTGHVKTFEYRPLHSNKRLNLILTISGWMNGKVDDVRLPFSTIDPVMGDIYSLLWEPDMLQSTGDTINILATEALTQTIQQVLGSTLLVALMASIQLPVVLTKLAYLIDNPWTVSLDRANAAGLILADSLIDRHLGQRPITLVGFSLGARLIFSCLKELAARSAYGIIQNVYLFGSPIVAKKDDYMRARTVISGRFVNGYASNDWILGYLFRATSGGLMRIAGLAPVEDIPGLENFDVTALVPGHMAYRAAMPRLMREVGWEVESDEFTEIEDPDPENHQKRQRELINEIDEARRKAEAKPEKRRFGFFSRGKLAEKRGWETYDKDSAKNGTEGPGSPGLENNVLFDIEAIRRELESEMIEVRELDSTLPPMQITTLANGQKSFEPFPIPTDLDLKPGEAARFKMAPLPHEIEEPAHQRTPSIPSAPGVLPSKPPAPIPTEDDEFGFVPREVKSTLPPLRLTPSLPIPEGWTTPTRPEFKSHATMPNRSSLVTMPTSPTVTSPILEHNAWADDDVDGKTPDGKEKEIRMSFG